MKIHPLSAFLALAISATTSAQQDTLEPTSSPSYSVIQNYSKLAQPDGSCADSSDNEFSYVIIDNSTLLGPNFDDCALACDNLGIATGSLMYVNGFTLVDKGLGNPNRCRCHYDNQANVPSGLTNDVFFGFGVGEVEGVVGDGSQTCFRRDVSDFYLMNDMCSARLRLICIAPTIG